MNAVYAPRRVKKRPAFNYAIHCAGDGRWQVKLGNKICWAGENEAAAEIVFKSLRGGQPITDPVAP